MLLVTTAMKPLSDFTTPRRLIPLISRHFLPVEHPEPACCTTGLKNGSRFPFMAHFLSSALGFAGSPALATGAAATGAAATVIALAGAVLASLVSVLGAPALGAAAFASATFGPGVALVVVTVAIAVFAVETGTAFAGAGALFAVTGAAVGDPPCVCRISANLPAGPDDTS